MKTAIAPGWTQPSHTDHALSGLPRMHPRKLKPVAPMPIPPHMDLLSLSALILALATLMGGSLLNGIHLSPLGALAALLIAILGPLATMIRPMDLHLEPMPLQRIALFARGDFP